MNFVFSPVGRFFMLVLMVLGLAACGDKPPIKVGFLGGMSGRVADLGVAGRNATQLAVETINAQGGIKGRQIELITRDDEQTVDLARRGFIELADAGVVAVIGPMTSAMAAAVLPLADERKLLLLAPTVTANEFGGRDDYFIRVASSTRIYALVSAHHQYNVVGMRQVALISDLRNAAYSTSWAGDFKAAFTQLGGGVRFEHGFESGDDAGLAAIVKTALQTGPDGVVLIANSVDAALLTQQIRQQAGALPIATAEWSATERYIELAGKAADGVSMAQFVDRNSQAPAYLAFRQRYLDRFGDEPGFAGVAAYDAAMVLMTALAEDTQRSPREIILSMRRFAGVQGIIDFDAFGDAVREVFPTLVVDGKYIVVSNEANER